ncbi:MAG: hypothetical protein EXX96DRAFT_596933 [Benjaminiella poitrasii]|nr:MAG: hypothetical protein EXX96DRAFT_596933 [Benjaminiella poitrasii]
MDKWFDDQLKKMELGGNEKARLFFESQPDYSPNMPTTEKYHTHCAELYREKLTAEAEGRPWTPTIASRSKSKPATTNNTRTAHGGTRSLNSQQTRSAASLSNTQRSNSSISMSGFGSDSYNNNNNDNSNSINSFGNNRKEQNEQYFAQLGNKNESRPEHLPPSQGGKYTGFGNPQFEDDYNSRNNNGGSLDIHEVINDPRVAIEKGWSLLSYVGKAAIELGKYANDNYVKPAAAQLADPNFREHVRENVSSYVSSLTQQNTRNSFYTGSETGSSTPYSAMNSSHTTDYQDDDFFNSTIHNLQSDDNLSGRHTPTSTSTPPAKINSRSATAATSSVRARANSAARKKADANSDDEWGTW